MFKDEAAILQAAATLAAAQHTASAIRESASTSAFGRAFAQPTPVDRLVKILREMESGGLILAGLAPPEPETPPSP
jgi:hypothetical protein